MKREEDLIKKTTGTPSNYKNVPVKVLFKKTHPTGFELREVIFGLYGYRRVSNCAPRRVQILAQ